jgi:hypothetical protein
VKDPPSRDRHLDYYLGLAQEADPGLLGPSRWSGAAGSTLSATTFRGGAGMGRDARIGRWRDGGVDARGDAVCGRGQDRGCARAVLDAARSFRENFSRVMALVERAPADRALKATILVVAGYVAHCPSRPRRPGCDSPTRPRALAGARRPARHRGRDGPPGRDGDLAGRPRPRRERCSRKRGRCFVRRAVKRRRHRASDRRLPRSGSAGAGRPRACSRPLRGESRGGDSRAETGTRPPIRAATWRASGCSAARRNGRPSS